MTTVQLNRAITAGLDTQPAQRLVKLCGMFGSEHDGERAAAALKADELVRGLGLTWSDIFLKSAAILFRNDWQRMAEYCHQHRWQLNERERRFIEAMLNWQGEPSERQQQWLIDIYARLHRGSGK
jgi:hypothetical protein